MLDTHISEAMDLKSWRKSKGLSMAAAGELLGLSQPSLSRIEAGKQWPDRPTMERIQAATGGAVTPNDFVSGSHFGSTPEEVFAP